ncbi:MAG: hypothetical protein BRD42_09585 [Bacteroidetes bacterium QS_3_64_15]|nr:MAG: hypothetical protein BRD42_09585 [Bacteroidetes bacterium QS_3_64_15]
MQLGDGAEDLSDERPRSESAASLPIPMHKPMGKPEQPKARWRGTNDRFHSAESNRGPFRICLVD